MIKSNMSMSTKGLDMACYFLRDKIYSDKVLACVREYICNAFDEHIKHNVQTPVFVNMHKSDDNECIWSVRDYAKGLSEDHVRNVFGMYFESTKSNTNSMIGGFGIGSKAGHCYTDTFYIKSHFEGTCTFYACVLGGGEKGIPVGELYKVSENPTTESGIEISFTVKPGDTHKFHNTTYTLVRCFGIENAIKFTSDYGDTIGDVVPDVPVKTIELNGFKFNQYENLQSAFAGKLYPYKTFIRMGGIIYKSICSRHERNYKSDIVVDVPIGKLSIPISREYIEDTAANNAVVSKILDEIVKMHDAELQEVPDISLSEYILTENKGWIDIGWFKFISSALYPEHRSLSYHIHRFGISYNSKPERIDNKLPVYVMHECSTSTKNKWLQRLYAHLGETGFLHFNEREQEYLIQEAPKHKIDISDIEFIPFRKAGIPAIPRSAPSGVVKSSFNVYESWNLLKAYTPEELEQRAEQKTGKKLKKNWFLTCDDLFTLKSRTIAHNRSWDGIYVKSKRLYDDMLKMGWICVHSQDYNTAYRRIQQNIENASKLQSMEKRVNGLFKTQINKVVAKRAVNNSKIINRIELLKERILKENSIRKHILSALTNVNPYQDIKLPRSVMRHILLQKEEV